MTYIPALDGVRALAVIAVVAFHCGIPAARGGMVGVDLFFVLSGYLITTILRRELLKTGKISLAGFYWSRMLRLWPPLILFLVFYYWLGAFLFPGIEVLPQIGIAALYLTDYSMAIWRSPAELGHTWSLSVEEHFYLVWPLFLLTTRSLTIAGLPKCWQSVLSLPRPGE